MYVEAVETMKHLNILYEHNSTVAVFCSLLNVLGHPLRPYEVYGLSVTIEGSILTFIWPFVYL